MCQWKGKEELEHFGAQSTEGTSHVFGVQVTTGGTAEVQQCAGALQLVHIKVHIKDNNQGDHIPKVWGSHHNSIGIFAQLLQLATPSTSSRVPVVQHHVKPAAAVVPLLPPLPPLLHL